MFDVHAIADHQDDVLRPRILCRVHHRCVNLRIVDDLRSGVNLARQRGEILRAGTARRDRHQFVGVTTRGVGHVRAHFTQIADA